jgi:hypothetical protein
MYVPNDGNPPSGNPPGRSEVLSVTPELHPGHGPDRHLAGVAEGVFRVDDTEERGCPQHWTLEKLTVMRAGRAVGRMAAPTEGDAELRRERFQLRIDP